MKSKVCSLKRDENRHRCLPPEDSRIFRTFVSVKQTVVDMADVLKSMNEKLESTQKTIDSQYGTMCALNRNINKLIGCPVRCFENLKRSSCWPGGTEGQYEDRVMRMVNWLPIQLFGNSEQFKRRARDRSVVM